MVRPFNWRIVYIEGNHEKFWRMDGNNSTYTIKKNWELWKKRIKKEDWQYAIEVYECSTMEEVPSLFATFNSAESSRNANEIYDTVIATIPELHVIERRLAIYTAIRGAAYSKGRNVLKRSIDKAEYIRDYVDYVLFMEELFGKYSQVRPPTTRPKNIFSDGGVARVVFETFNKAPMAAREFWTAVAYNQGEHIFTATRKLHEFLVAAIVTQSLSTQQYRADRKTVDKYPIACVCVGAWNKWQEGAVVKNLCTKKELAELWENKKQELNQDYIFNSRKKRLINRQNKARSHRNAVRRFSLREENEKINGDE